MGIINIKGGETLKKKQYKQSKFKYLLINSRDLSHKLFSLNEDQKELALQFITGENDIEDDDAWEEYIDDVKSQTDEDFDEIIEMLNEKTVK